MWPRTLPRSADRAEAWSTCDSWWLRGHFWEHSRGGPGRGQRVVQREGKADAGPESSSRGRGQLPVTPLEKKAYFEAQAGSEKAPEVKF